MIKSILDNHSEYKLLSGFDLALQTFEAHICVFCHAGLDNLARCGAMESLVNDMADTTWDERAQNRISAIRFLDDGNDEDDDDEKVSVPNVFNVSAIEAHLPLLTKAPTKNRTCNNILGCAFGDCELNVTHVSCVYTVSQRPVC